MTYKTFMILVFLFVFCFSSHVYADKWEQLETILQNEIRKIQENLDGILGIAIQDVKTGRTLLVNENEIFPQASSIKIAILFEIFKQAEEGKVEIHKFIELKEKDKVEGSGVLYFLGTPSLSISIRDLCVLMMSLSDNTATNILIAIVGMDAVNRRMESIGLAHTKLRRKMMDRQSALDGNENISTPREMMLLLQHVLKQDVMKEPFRSEFLKIFSVYKDSFLRKAVPEEISVANKPGELEAVRCDSGIVFLPRGPYILCVMTTYLKDENKGNDAIFAISRLVYQHFTRVQNSSEYGRLLYDK